MYVFCYFFVCIPFYIFIFNLRIFVIFKLPFINFTYIIHVFHDVILYIPGIVLREQLERQGRLSPFSPACPPPAEVTVLDPERTEWLSLQLTLDTVTMATER